jgi:hypothetical protein
MPRTPQCVHLVRYSRGRFSHFSSQFFKAGSDRVPEAKPLAELAVQGTGFVFIGNIFPPYAQRVVSNTPVVVGPGIIRV